MSMDNRLKLRIANAARIAHDAGKSASENPYHPAADDWQVWNDAWEEAELVEPQSKVGQKERFKGL